MFNSNTSGFDDVFKMFDKLQGTKEEVKRKAVNAGGTLLKNQMINNSPYNEGREVGKHMNETIRKTTKIENGEIITRVYPTKWYDLFAEYGDSNTAPTFFVARTWNDNKVFVEKLMIKIIMKYLDKQIK